MGEQEAKQDATASWFYYSPRKEKHAGKQTRNETELRIKAKTITSHQSYNCSKNNTQQTYIAKQRQD